MKKLILVLPILFITVMIACRKEQPQMPILNDDCDCANEVSAEFTMEELGGNPEGMFGDYRTETDTIYGASPVMFSALEKDADYTWYIGAEVINEKEFWRNFDNSLKSQTLPMTLVVKKQPNTICFPNDDGYDSITKNLTVVDAHDIFGGNNHLDGVYRMKDSSTIDSIDITVSHDPSFIYSNGSNGGQRVVFYNLGLFNGGEEIACLPFVNNYKQIWAGSAGCFQKGTLKVLDRDNVELIIDGATLLTECASKYHYYGRKIN